MTKMVPAAFARTPVATAFAMPFGANSHCALWLLADGAMRVSEKR